jgi:dihydroflavonol-4-reductase
MKTHVTGASGHLGANLVRELLRCNEPARALVHRDTLGIDGLDVEIVRGDLGDLDSLRAAMAGVDIVYNLAGVISIDGDRHGRVRAVNVDGARNVAQAALECGVRRLVHCSSIHAFDPSDGEGTLDESWPRVADPSGHSAYDRSKASGEREVRRFIERGLDAVIVHPTGCIGPFDFQPSRMGRVLIDVQRRRLPSLIPGGFSWVDARDVAQGAIAAGRRGRCGESYLLAGHWLDVSELVTLAAQVAGVRPPAITTPMWLARLGAPFVTMVGRMLGREPLYTAEALRALREFRPVSHAKAARELDYEPRPLRETLVDYYGWLAETPTRSLTAG